MKSDSGDLRYGEAVKLATESEYEFVSYLDSLLSEIDEMPEISGESVTKVANLDADTRHHRPDPTFPNEPDGDFSSVDTDTSDVVSPDPAELPILPPWAHAPFQVLMIEIYGTTFGVPLISLREVLLCSDRPCQLPGQPVWQLGVLCHRDQQVVVVDTARLIMPKHSDRPREEWNLSKGYLLVVGEGEVALLIDKFDSRIKMEKQHIRWRCGSNGRRWMAGIIIDELSVLLDVDGLLSDLEAA